MRADGLDDRDAGLLEQAGEVPHLADVVRDRLLVGCLSDPLGERLHVMAGKAAVVREAFEDDDQLARPACDVVVVGREEAADRARSGPSSTRTPHRLRAMRSRGGSRASAGRPGPGSRSAMKTAFSEERVASR